MSPSILLLILSIQSSQSLPTTTISTPPPLVKLPLGTVQGYWDYSDTNKLTRVFKGIPFAAPPIGNRRFRAPEPVEPWNGVLDATKPSPSCIQKEIPVFGRQPYTRLFIGDTRSGTSEDCLKLNIYAPKETKEKLAVMFWIYGGGFARGGIEQEAYDGRNLATEENVIVVAANYRLASLGFLYLGQEEAPGNMGLMDQVMALKWVRDNIGHFGGDPARVTIFGQSAGSSSVGYHLILPESRNLFQRAIMQSGSPTSMFSFERRSVLLDNAKTLLRDIGCPFNLDNPGNRTEAIECLKTKDANDILDNEMAYGYDYIYIFKPVVDGVFIKDHPVKLLLDKKNTKKTEVMIGSVRDESSFFLVAMSPLEFQLRDGIKLLKSTVRQEIADSFGMEDMAIDIIFALYLNNNKNLVNSALDVTNDMMFTCSIQDIERAVKYAGGTVYKYYFMYRTKNISLPLWIGVHHGIEILYVFGHPLKKEYSYTEEERQFASHIMKTWANFAKTGNPNLLKNMKDRSSLWPEFTLEGEEYMVLAPNSTAVGHHLRSKYCVFWNEIIPKLIHEQKTKNRGFMELYRDGV